jgi:hypothetical protein
MEKLGASHSAHSRARESMLRGDERIGISVCLRVDQHARIEQAMRVEGALGGFERLGE